MASKRYYDNDINKMMRKSSGLIHEAAGEPCLLPTEVISKDFPKAEYGMNGGIGNLFTGVQKQMGIDKADLHRAFNPKKY